MKKRYLALVALFAFFTFIKIPKALLGICSYQEMRDDDKTPLMTYINLYNGKRMIATSDTSVQDKVDFAEVSWYGDLVSYLYLDTDWSIYYFSGAYTKTYLSPYMPYGEGKRAIQRDVIWLNRYEEGSSEAINNDVKKRFIEEGVCPTFTCYCPSAATWVFYNGNKSNDIDYARAHCEDPEQGMQKRYNFSEKCIFQENVIDMLQEQYFTVKEENSNLQSGALKILNNNFKELKSEEINALINKLSFKSITAKTATDLEFSVLARLVGDRETTVIVNGNVEKIPAVSTIVQKILDNSNNSDIKNELKSEYQELVTAARTFQKRYGSDPLKPIGTIGDNSCSSLIGDVKDKESFAYYLNIILHTIQYGGPILVIILTTIEYFKAILNNNKESLTNANKKTASRIIYMLLLFYIPTFINFLLQTLGGITTDCNIG